MASIDFVNPLYSNGLEQVHAVVGSPETIPINPDLL